MHLNKNEQARVRRKITLLALLCFALGYTAMAQVNCSFTTSATNGCPGLTVNFTDQSTGGVASHYWDFDGLGTSTAANPTQVFTVPNIYNVKHIVRNAGATSTDTCFVQIQVYAPPVVNFASGNTEGCNNPCHTVNFVNQSAPGSAPILEYVWDFGDGSLAESASPSAPNASHCYNAIGNYPVILIARDANGCQSDTTKNNFVTIRTAPTANITANPTSACTAPTVVNFSGSGTSPNGGSLTYTWAFGNGGTAAGQTATQVYQTGIYTATVTALDPIGCTATATQNIQITPITADFGASAYTVCRGLPVQFTDSSNYASAWSWNFGVPSGTSTQRNPSYTFNANGTYTVTLTATYNGCTGSVSKTITVVDPVDASFVGDDTSGCAAPHTVNFTSTIGSGASSLLWNFGDNQTSTQANPSHTYTANGNYNVTLTVNSVSGCANVVRYNQYIDVGILTPTFTVDSTSGCAPLTVRFTNNSTAARPITGYLWDFGDGTPTSTAQNPTHVYTVNGQYKPTLTITTVDGCTKTYVYPGNINVGGPGNPDFVATPTIQCVNQPIVFTDLTTNVNPAATYFWQFGDGGTSTDQNPTYEYGDIGTFSVTLTIVYNGCSTVLVKNNYIRIVVPKAEFGFQFDCLNPSTVTFSDSSQGAQTWFWDFGDGQSSTLQNPVHTYATQSTYAVTLVVTNTTTGCVDSITKVLPFGTPTAQFTSDTTTGCTRLRIRYTDQSTFASSWLWRFGDGTTSTAQNPTKFYDLPGLYTVTLIINPGQPCSDSIVMTDYIQAYGVTAEFAADYYAGCSPLAVAFTDSSTSFQSNIVSWQWILDAGDTAYTKNTNHVYTSATPSTLYTILLTVTDSRGCVGTKFRSVRAINVIPYFTSDSIACPGESITFYDSSQALNFFAYSWDFGDGSPLINDDTVTHAYTAPGTYTVSLTVTSNAVGPICSQTYTRPTPIVVANPNIDFFVNANFDPCPPFPVQFTNIADRDDLTYEWYFGDGDTSTFQNPLHVYDMPGKYTVTLIGKAPAGCSDTVTYIDLVYAGGPTGVFTASTDSGCVPLAIDISATVDGTTTAYTLTTGDGTVYPDSLFVTHTYTTPGNYTVTFNLTDSLGCSFPYDFDTIVVGAIPYPNLPTDTVVCKGNYIRFNLTEGDIFSWTASESPTFLSCNDCPSPLITAPDTITYYVTATTNIGCSASDTVLVNVDALPQIFPGVSFRICPSDTLQLSAGPNVQAATWTPNLFISDTNSVNPVVYPSDTIVYRVTGSNSTGCSISRIVRVEVIDKVVANLTFNDTLLCEGGAVQLSLNVEQASYNDTSYMWTPPSYLSSPLIQDPLFNGPHGTYTYTVITRSSTCIPDTDVVNIEVAPKPAVEAGDDQTVAVGTQVQLWAASPNPVNYYWTATADSFSCTNCRRPFIVVNQNQTVYATARNEFGCEASDSVVLKVVSCDPNSVFVPNTFTPNNDDLNDVLYVRGIGLKSLEYFRVFDRWGQMVFETKNLSEGWDGLLPGTDRVCDLGVYVYMMKGVCSSGQEMEKSGNVTLVR